MADDFKQLRTRTSHSYGCRCCATGNKATRAKLKSQDRRDWEEVDAEVEHEELIAQVKRLADEWKPQLDWLARH